MRKRIIVAAFLLITLTLTGCGRKQPNNEAVPVMITNAALPTDDDSSHVYSGTVEPDVSVNIAFTVGGYIRGILNVPGPNGQLRLVQAGDFVRKNTLLAQVRDVDYLAQVDLASAQVAGKIALSQQAQSGYQQAQAALDRASAGVSDSMAVRDQAKTGYEQAKSGLAAAKSQLAEAQAGAQAVRAQMEQAAAGQEKAQADYKRAERLYSTKSLTRADYDAAKAQMKASNAQLKAAKEQVNVAETKIEQAKAQIEANKSKMSETQALIKQSEAGIRSAKAQKRAAYAAVRGAEAQVTASNAGTRASRAQLTQAKTPLGDTSLKSPIDGVILKRNIEIGTLVGPGTPGFVIADLTSVKVVFGVPDVLLPLLHIHDDVIVTTQAYENRQYVGKITSISPNADPQSHVFQVEVTIPNKDRALKVGMIAKVELVKLNGVKSYPVVPLSAIVKSNRHKGGYAVYVVSDEHGKLVARAREIQIGDTFGNTIAVKNGINIGDRVISTGATLVNDGTPVTVVK